MLLFISGASAILGTIGEAPGCEVIRVVAKKESLLEEDVLMGHTVFINVETHWVEGGKDNSAISQPL